MPFTGPCIVRPVPLREGESLAQVSTFTLVRSVRQRMKKRAERAVLFEVLVLIRRQELRDWQIPAKLPPPETAQRPCRKGRWRASVDQFKEPNVKKRWYRLQPVEHVLLTTDPDALQNSGHAQDMFDRGRHLYNRSLPPTSLIPVPGVVDFLLGGCFVLEEHAETVNALSKRDLLEGGDRGIPWVGVLLRSSIRQLHRSSLRHLSQPSHAAHLRRIRRSRTGENDPSTLRICVSCYSTENMDLLQFGQLCEGGR